MMIGQRNVGAQLKTIIISYFVLLLFLAKQFAKEIIIFWRKQLNEAQQFAFKEEINCSLFPFISCVQRKISFFFSFKKHWFVCFVLFSFFTVISTAANGKKKSSKYSRGVDQTANNGAQSNNRRRAKRRGKKNLTQSETYCRRHSSRLTKKKRSRKRFRIDHKIVA